MTDEDVDIFFMREALAIAETGRGKTDFAPSIGCVLVKNQKIYVRARTADGGVPHAEDRALLELAKKGISARGFTAYVTLEPCATPDPGACKCCTDLLIKAEVSRVVMACLDPDHKTNGKGLERLKKAGIETRVGVLQNEAIQQNVWFYESRGVKVS